MKKKIMLVGPDAVRKIGQGVDRVADAVRLTSGPYGRNFASGIRGGAIRISNDGVSLAKEIEGRNEFEHVGVRATQDSASRANEVAGDGSTTNVILMQEIYHTLAKDPDVVAIRNPIALFKEAKEEGKKIVELLNGMARPVESLEHLIKVVQVSVEDEALATLIATANWKVGKNGTLLAEGSNAKEDSVEYITGVRIDNGYGTSRLANNLEKMTLEVGEVHVLVTDYTMNTVAKMAALKPVFEQLNAAGTKGVAIIARGWDETAIGICIKNIEAGFNIYPLSAPYENHTEIMEDLAAITGGKFIKTTERNLESLQMSDFGRSKKIYATRYEGIVAGVAGDERIDALVLARVERIEEMLKGEISPFEKRGLEQRLAQLTGGTAMLRIGAETEQERNYKKDKVDDAINASRGALNEGVVPGAGQALVAVADHLGTDSLLSNALRAPYNQIMANAGGQFEVPAWVEDPLVVVRTAFEKALSIAGSLATTEILTAHEDEQPMWVKQTPQAEE